MHATPDGDRAKCGLVTQLVGKHSGDFAQVRTDQCQFCLTLPEPTVGTPNAAVASLVYSVTTASDGLSQDDVDRLRAFAVPYLEIASSRCPEMRVPIYKSLCFFLGDHIDDRECTGCKSTVTRKVFQCRHEEHESTTIAECRACADYDPSYARGDVSTWAVGLTTAPHRTSMLQSTLESLALAGWPDPLVFSEPGSDEEAMKGKRTVQRETTLGAWPNWYLGLSELVSQDPHAEAYLVCQEDAMFCANPREYLEATLWPAERTGIVSLHTPKYPSRSTNEGFFAQDVGWGAWGAMAYILPNASARALLRDSRAVNHRSRGPRDGLVNVDSVVGSWCQRAEFSYHMHARAFANIPGRHQHSGRRHHSGARGLLRIFPETNSMHVIAFDSSTVWRVVQRLYI